jgi:hypothetical protein
MSFFFRMASRLRPSTPEEVVRSIKDSFLALHTRTHAKVISESLRLLSPLQPGILSKSPVVLAPFFFPWRSRGQSIHANPISDSLR